MKAIEVEEAVARLFGYRRCLIVPNVHWSLFRYELDLLIVRPSGYAVEVEIKVSKSDLKKDAEKKHGHQDHKNRIKELYFAVPESLFAAALQYAPAEAGIIAVAAADKSDPISFRSYWQKAVIRRPAVKRKNAVPFSAADRSYIGHLGSMRIWGLKASLIETQARLVEIQSGLNGNK